MKILIAILLFAFPYISNAQIILRTVEMSTLDGNTTDREPIPVKVSYKVTLTETELHVYSNTPKTYFIKKTLDSRNNSDENITVFQCLDNSNVLCKLMISYYKKTPVKGCSYRFVIMYNNRPQKIINYLLNVANK